MLKIDKKLLKTRKENIVGIKIEASEMMKLIKKNEGKVVIGDEGIKSINIFHLRNLIEFGLIGMTEITFHDEIEFIGINSFNFGTGASATATKYREIGKTIKKINFGKNLKEISGNAFVSLIGLKEVNFHKEGNGELNILHEGTFRNCGIEKLHFPKNLKSLYGFYDNTKLKEISFEKDSICSEINGFDDCEKLEGIVIPKTVTFIRGFKKCACIEKLIFEKGSMCKELYGFSGIGKLKKLVLPGSIREIDGFDDCLFEEIKFENPEIEDKNDKLWLRGFNNCKKLEKVNFEEIRRLETISNCFSGNKIKKAIFNGNIKILSHFKDCNSLESVIVKAPKGGESEFLNIKGFVCCDKLKEVNIKKKVDILYSSFIDCKNLEKVKFSYPIKKINGPVGNGCPKIKIEGLGIDKNGNINLESSSYFFVKGVKSVSFDFMNLIYPEQLLSKKNIRLHIKELSIENDFFLIHGRIGSSSEFNLNNINTFSQGKTNIFTYEFNFKDEKLFEIFRQLLDKRSNQMISTFFVKENIDFNNNVNDEKICFIRTKKLKNLIKEL